MKSNNPNGGEKIMLKSRMFMAAAMAAMVAASPIARAEEQPTQKELMEKIQQLENRVKEMEAKQAEQISVPSAEMPSKTLEFLGQTEIGGGIMATWFTDFSKPGKSGTAIPALGVGTYNHNAFSINLAEIVLENASEANAEKWDGGYKVSVLLGQDVAGLLDGLGFGSGGSGDIGAVWEAYASLNLPIGNGIVTKVGKFATYIGNEVVQPWANPHITYGFQFALVEPFTHTGIAFETPLTDTIGLAFSINNGWDQTYENGDGVSFLAQLSLTPGEKTKIVLNGYYGSETGQASEQRYGLDAVISQQLSEKLSATIQLDAGWQDFDSSADATYLAAGAWLGCTLSDMWSVNFRGEYLYGNEGLPGTGFSAGLTEDKLNLLSGTVTLICRPPVPGLEGRLELRYDNTNDEALFGGPNDRVILSVGALYSF
jgi:hypothetical protein